MSATIYDAHFYENQRDNSLISAQEVWPIILQYIQPKSVIDIGCGVGTWLKALSDSGIKDYSGVDGDYVRPIDLLIPKEKFVAHDLRYFYNAPQKYDLAISLEVGEHLPETSSDDLVKSLTTASDTILFSAALPGQMGTFHINEQWPEYWAKKFATHGYVPIDCIRKHIWNNSRIDIWYRQNTILYIRAALLQSPEYKNLQNLSDRTDPEFLTRIHPELFSYYQKKMLWLTTFEGFARFKLARFKKKK